MLAKIDQVWEHCLDMSPMPLDWNKSIVFKIVEINYHPDISCMCKIISDTITASYYESKDTFWIGFEPENFPNWRSLSSPGWSCTRCNQEFPELTTIFPAHQKLKPNYGEICWECKLQDLNLAASMFNKKEIAAAQRRYLMDT